MTWLFAIMVILPANPWTVNGWAPLMERYTDCQVRAVSEQGYYLCAELAKYEAAHPVWYA